MTEQSRGRLGASVGERWTAMQGGRIAAAHDAERRGRALPQDESASEARRERIAAEARNAIFWDLAVPRNRVSVRCDHGWVTLTGAVERPYQRSAAEADVRRVPGVLGVTNAITVTAKAAEQAPAAD